MLRTGSSCPGLGHRSGTRAIKCRRATAKGRECTAGHAGPGRPGAAGFVEPQADGSSAKGGNISQEAKQRAQDRRENYLRMLRQRPKAEQLKAAGKQLAAAKAAKAASKNEKMGSFAAPLAAIAPPGPGGIPDYFGTTPNWAYTPTSVRKFVDPLPRLYVSGVSPSPAPGTQYIPVAVPDTTTYPGSDYYEIELGQYTEKMHSDLPATTLRGYRQTNASDSYVTQFHYLGPMIVAQKDKPVRIKFTNNLPTGTGGNLFIPVDTTIMGSGPYEINYDPDNQGDHSHHYRHVRAEPGRYPSPWRPHAVDQRRDAPPVDYPEGRGRFLYQGRQCGVCA